MFLFNKMRLFVPGVIALALTVCGYAAPIDLDQRIIPFEVTQDGVLSGTLTQRQVEESSVLEVRPVLTSEESQRLYGLLVPTDDLETTVTINGYELFLTPAYRPGAVVHYLDPRRLTEGENIIEIERADDGPWAGLVMFSLLDGFEEAHFGEVFSVPMEEEGISTREIPPSSSQDNYDVLWYDCTWIPRISGVYMEAGSNVIIGARALTNLSYIDVDFDIGGYFEFNGTMTIDSVDMGQGTPAITWMNIANYDAPRVRIYLPAQVAAGTDFQVRIFYHGQPNTAFPKRLFNRDAFNRKTTSGGGIMIYSESQPYGARRWWPCKDHPSDKATTSIQRIRVPKNSGYNLTAVSNGSLEATNDLGAMTEFVWVNHYPIATYLMSLCVGNYVYTGTNYTSRDGLTQMPIGAYILPEDMGFEGTGYLGTLQVMNFLADLFGEYPYLDEKYVTVAWGDSFAIEHQTATSMPAGSTAGLYHGLTRRNVHELVHQWYGNKITMHSWDHLWLNEGFATYGEALFEEHMYGRAAFRQYVRDWNVGNGPVVSSNADSFGDSNYYKRAAKVLDMLRLYLGDAAFFQALRDYAAVGYTTAMSQPGDSGGGVKFQTVVEESAGLAPGSLQTFFDQWLHGSSFGPNHRSRPTYAFSVSYDVLTSSAIVRVKQIQDMQPFDMPVPFRLRAADSSTTDILMPAGATQHSFALGSFRPISYEIDPEDWLLRSDGLYVQAVDLAPATVDAPYTFSVGYTNNNSGSASWQKLSGTPVWLSVNSAGLISGTPSAAGVYPVNLRLTNSNGHSIDVSYKLVVKSGGPQPVVPDVVINEISYQCRGNLDNGEFVELYNRSGETADIGGWQVVIAGPPGSASSQVTLPPGAMIDADGYYVLGNASAFAPVYPGVIDFDTGWFDSLPDSGPGGIVLRTAAGVRVDSLTYHSDSSYGSGSDWTSMLVAGGTGRLVSWNLADTGSNATLGRLPNGVNTESNLQDFAGMPPTPGAENSAGVTLPFFDDFNGGARPEWRPAYTAPVRVVSPGTTGKPIVAAPAPAGGQVMEVYDPTGGGDVSYLPGAFDQINYEGYIWIPQWQDSSPWSTGLGINTRVESAWFSTVQGYELPNGFYLEYQNGNGVDLRGGQIPNSPGQARFFAMDSSSVPGVGYSLAVFTPLGTPVTPPASSWQPFRLVFDGPGDRLYAKLGEQVIYDGPIPPGNFNTSGGVCVGFRENHRFNIIEENREGTWVDNVKVDTNVTADTRVRDYILY